MHAHVLAGSLSRCSHCAHAHPGGGRLSVSFCSHCAHAGTGGVSISFSLSSALGIFHHGAPRQLSTPAPTLSPHRPQGKSYLYFTQFKAEVRGAEIEYAMAYVSASHRDLSM